MRNNRLVREVMAGTAITLFLMSHGPSAWAQTKTTRTAQLDKAMPRYGHCVDVGLGGCETGHFAKTGKGYAVCETYLKHLNVLKEMPKCEAPIPPGFKQPAWEELDVMAHLQLAYQAEVIAGRGGNYEKSGFEAWRQQLLSEKQAGRIAPRLRKTTVRPFGKKSITLLAYTRDRAVCENRARTPDSGWADNNGYVHFLLVDDPQKPLRAIDDRVTKRQSELLLYAGKPYFVMLDTYYPSFEIIAFDLEMTDTSARVATMNAYYAKVAPSERMDMTNKEFERDPNVYRTGQHCHFLPVKPTKR